ncbi:MAG: hypothetical protein HY053_09645 [Proteobacteria bacterium]|nr:hypothetical protein [Pseudomonadota bacterium]
MKKLSLLLGVMLIPAFGASAFAQDYDHPQLQPAAQFHRDIAQFHRDQNNNPPAVQSQTQVRLFRVRDDNDNDLHNNDHHDNDRHDNNRHDNDRHDHDRNNTRTDNDRDEHRDSHDWNRDSRDWGRDHHRDNDRRESHNDHFNTRVIVNNHWRGWDRDRDIREFHHRDFSSWRGGKWWHGHHNGRDGWWWAVGNLLYFYSHPIYPYPDPYAPQIVIESASYAPGYWYYCADPSGYYPYVDECYVPWRAVPQ